MGEGEMRFSIRNLEVERGRADVARISFLGITRTQEDGVLAVAWPSRRPRSDGLWPSRFWARNSTARGHRSLFSDHHRLAGDRARIHSVRPWFHRHIGVPREVRREDGQFALQRL